MLPLVSHDEYVDGRDRQTDGRTDAQTVTLRFLLDAASVLSVLKQILVANYW